MTMMLNLKVDQLNIFLNKELRIFRRVFVSGLIAYFSVITR